MYLSQIYPKPKNFFETDSTPFSFGAAATLTLSRPLPYEAIERMKALWHRFSFTASELTVLCRPDADGSDRFSATLGTPERKIEKTLSYYNLHSDQGGVVLHAVSEKALIDGFSTLVQLIIPVCLETGKEALLIAPTEIDDEPSLAFRAIHLCIFPETKLFTIEKAIHLAGFLKMTHCILEFWGTYRYETEKSLAWAEHAFTRSEIKPLVDLCHSYGMEVIPMFNHLGHAAQSRIDMGRHVVLNQNPRLQMLFEPDGWTWCSSNPDTARILAGVRAELSELCGTGRYFHIGCDEAYSFASCPACRRQVPHELLADYINRLTEELAADGRRPILWHDQFVRRSDFVCLTEEPVEANGEKNNTYRALDLLDRRVIIADWQYNCKTPNVPTIAYFVKKGFDTVACPWRRLPNVASLCDAARANGAMGVLLTTWHLLPSLLPDQLDFANCVWQTNASEIRPAPRATAAAILRKLHESTAYEEAGWCRFEVED